MQTFIGSKLVKTREMTRGEYNTYRGWELPKDENGLDPGYLVEYQDGGKPNIPNHSGYVSWSPKEQFDAGYVDLGKVEGLQPHQVRILAELVQLEDRLKKLETFLLSDVYQSLDDDDQLLLTTQAGVMTQYLAVLNTRVERWELTEY